ncbi:hypothetical protein [Pseudophaeobacter sp.]|uniref:hypothetical protein n=1 Tax=Pseudophaeobacter sp. TaxID=1971739 RepID=UPI003296E4C0
MPDLTLFHTAQIHVETFNRLAPEAQLAHEVRPDWLARAQTGIDAALEQEITSTIAKTKGPRLCSCTTIGELAEAAGATRIDWPMMQAAARMSGQTGAPVMMAYCLNSTLAPSTELLRRAFAETGQKADIHPLDLTALWPLFEAGDTRAFAAAIAQAITTRQKDHPKAKAVVLAQASMAAAQAELQARLPIPTLSSPEIALQCLLPTSANHKD